MVLGGNHIGDLDTRQHQYHLKLAEIPCLRCGVCCSKYQPHLSLSEAYSLACKLGESWEQFLTRYTDHRWPGTQSVLIRHQDGSCIFLQSAQNGQRLCKIHDFKPACCRDWVSGLKRPECQQGLKDKWNLEVDPAGQINGERQSLEKFELYLKSIPE